MLTKLTRTEAKLFLRDPAAPVAVAGIPVGLLLVFGLQPGSRRPSADFGGQVPLSAFIAPLALAVLLGMLALTVFPAAVATYREKGVLRRLSASPVPPSRLLAAQLLVNVTAALVVVVLVLGVGTLALGMAAPAAPGWFLLVLVLGALALFGVGLAIAALAPSGRAASGIGSAVFFPMLALGGVWVPKEQLPGFLRHVADVLPLGATLNALRQAAVGAAPNGVQLVSLAVVALGCGAVAVRWFRWE